MKKLIRKCLWGIGGVSAAVLGYVALVCGQAGYRAQSNPEPRAPEPGFTVTQLHDVVVNLVAVRMAQGAWSFPVAGGAGYQAEEFQAVAGQPATRIQRREAITCGTEGEPPLVISSVEKGAWLLLPIFILDGFGEDQEEMIRLARENKNSLVTFVSTNGGKSGVTLHLDGQDWLASLRPRQLFAPSPYPYATGPCVELQAGHMPGWLQGIPTLAASASGQPFTELVAPSGRVWPVAEGRGQMHGGNLDRQATKKGFTVFGSGPEMAGLFEELTADVKARGGQPWLMWRHIKQRPDWGPEPRVSSIAYYKLANGGGRALSLMTSPAGAQLSLAASEGPKD
ncbi:hypothetical protein D3C71_24380 [compost metagenome]